MASQPGCPVARLAGSPVDRPTDLPVYRFSFVALILALTATTALADGPRVALIKDINPGGLSSKPGENVFFNMVGKLFNVMLFFPADDGVHGVELWKTDGTAAGTVLVADINPSGSGSPGSFVVFNNTLFFSATDGVHGIELWKSDGTAAGTVRVKDIRVGGLSGAFVDCRMAVSNGQLFFAAVDITHGAELWKTDGTEAGTGLLIDLCLPTRHVGFVVGQLRLCGCRVLGGLQRQQVARNLRLLQAHLMRLVLVPLVRRARLL